MPRPSILRRLGLTVLTILLVTFFVFGAAVLRTVGRLLEGGVRQQVDAAMDMLEPTVSDLLEQADYEGVERFCGKVGTLTRVSVLLPDGQVIGESQTEPRGLDNHLNRPEVRQAATEGIGFNRRHSHTLRVSFAYLARRIDAPDGRVLGYLRVAAPTALIDRARREAVERLLAALALLLPLAGAAAYGLMRQLTRPLSDMRHGAERFAAGDLRTPVRTAHSREMDALADCLNVMAEQLDTRLREVTRQRNETDTILRGMSEGVVATDAELRVLRINRAAAAVFGIDPAQARGGKLIEVARNAALHDTLQQALASNDPVEAETTVAGDAGTVSLSIRASRLPDSSGAVAVLHDTTRIRHLESMRRDFVANVSHELRTPITAIQGFVETLDDGAIDDPHMSRRFLATIQRNSERLGRIVEDLLLLSKLDNHTLGDAGLPGRERTSVATLVRAAAQTLEKTAEARQTRIEVEADAEAVFDVVPGFVQTAVANVIDNAIKYSPPGTVVRIRVRQSPEDTRIDIADQGPGIPSEHRARIFERFYRVDKGRSRELGGTGLGLAIVKHVMNVHGGLVELASREGAGSTFTLVFPVIAGRRPL